MLNTINSRAAAMSDVVFNASRQVWLAGLGAAVVTREWAEREAGTVFKNLVREGTVVESRAFRFVGDRLDTSLTQANTLWKQARRTVTTTMKNYADTATALVRETLPASLPNVPGKRAARPAKQSVAKRTRKTSAPRKVTKRARRTVKAGAKRS